MTTEMRHQTARKIAATAVALAATAASVAAPGTANADQSKTYAMHDCINISPNIVDMPYRPYRVIVSKYLSNTYLVIDYTSYWIGVGYDSAARLDWKNLTTGQKGTRIARNHISPPYPGTHQFQIPTAKLGPGKVKLTLSTVNSNALWAVPARSCSGVIVTP
ncbi:hypothetical protein [Gordonia phthalatica]|uniref:Uncharacterized protein n=1 Tax=Gordonia phthalatica TaxID=1136941 RepID=A0A0N9NE29_9ACTN|nr:hypothetical protein [Gordonia phthalatica]ALG85945.1 hypothetical protein ACH46_17440 [Gordonia phthalatica]